MASLTKQAIVASFLRLCAKKSPDRITVRDIVDDCEINRNTFYYYYQDVYALVEEVFLLWATEFCCACEGGEDLRVGLRALTDRALEHKKAAINLMLSFEAGLLEDCWLRATADYWIGWVRRRAAERSVSEESIRYVGMTYAIVFWGILRRWIRGSMREDAERMIGRYCAVWLMGVDDALLRHETNRNKNEEESET